ncbi:MAG: hypothetical protein Q4F21_11245 [Lachnospiraceae bacterium]|nr:hypothetical protein [Lachnospiraceae bacterium]
MNKRYDPLFKDLTLNNGVILHNRCAMAPMIVAGKSTDGTVDQEEVEYYRRRNRVGQLIIIGSCAVSKYGKAVTNENHIFEDSNRKELQKISSAIKESGNLAIMQLHFAGREAAGSVKQYGKAYAPSKMDFPWLNYHPEELTGEQVEALIEAYGNAARISIEAGFDGIEIHGGNHYIIQQFLSAYSNRREDQWGGCMEKRMAFPLAVVRRVKAVIAESGKEKIILGFRFCPEEIHGENIGYTIKDSLELVDRIADEGIDYLHSSTFSNVLINGPAYKRFGSDNSGIALNAMIYERINKRCAFMVCGQIKTAEEMLDALNYGDLFALGTLAITDPDCMDKIREGREFEIINDVSGREEELCLTSGLYQQYADVNDGPGLPPIKGISRKWINF